MGIPQLSQLVAIGVRRILLPELDKHAPNPA